MSSTSQEYVKFYAGQIVLVFQFLHSKGIAYRDLKPEVSSHQPLQLLTICLVQNLLLAPNGYLKVNHTRPAGGLSARGCCRSSTLDSPNVSRCRRAIGAAAV